MTKRVIFSKLLSACKQAGKAACKHGLAGAVGTLAISSAVAAAAFGAHLPMACIMGALTGSALGAGVQAVRAYREARRTGKPANVKKLFLSMGTGALMGGAVGFFALPGAMTALLNAGHGLVAFSSAAGIGALSGASYSFLFERKNGTLAPGKMLRHMIVYAAVMGAVNAGALYVKGSAASTQIPSSPNENAQIFKEAKAKPFLPA